MGVLGLTPFLLRHCPNVIQAIPDRLKAFTGKTIAIDGTLITQRLHWSPMPHTYRHVLGWYRIVKEFEEAGVNAICVFDGSERSEAKRAEMMRRRYTRRVNAQRGTIEKERLRRLQRLRQLLGTSMDGVSDEDGYARASLTEVLRKAICEDGISLEEPARYPSGYGEPTTRRSGLGDMDTSYPELGRQVTGRSDAALPVVEPDLELPPLEGTLSTQSLIHNVKTLFDEYRHSLHVTLGQDSVTAANGGDSEARELPTLGGVVGSVSESETDDTSKEIIVASKLQRLMTTEEGRVWSSLATDSSVAGGSGADPLEQLTHLAVRSQYVLSLYEKRGVPPSPSTYDESRMLLGAMGVPCLTSSGPYEGEALASSLVVNGHADYVASEDTDVLLYRAPLLRNLTTRRCPLHLFDPSSIHTALSLTPSQFIDFALLLGTDFTRRLPNIGPTRAFKFITMYGSVERVLESLDLEGKEARYRPRGVDGIEGYLREIEMGRAVFGSVPPVPTSTSSGDADAELKGGQRDEERVVELLDHFGLRRAVEEEERDGWGEGEGEHWGDEAALAGNYFGDDPREVVPAMALS